MMYDDEVFAGRFRLQLIMLEVCELIGLSGLFYAHVVHEIAVAKITTEFYQYRTVKRDLIRLNSIICRVQSTRCAMMTLSLIDSVI